MANGDSNSALPLPLPCCIRSAVRQSTHLLRLRSLGAESACTCAAPVHVIEKRIMGGISTTLVGAYLAHAH